MGVMCKILIHKPVEGVFKPGECVTGVVKYIIDEPEEIKNIILSLNGEGSCMFQRLVYNHAKYFYGRENFVVQNTNILDTGTEESVTLPEGSYEYPFKFILPNNIPTSYKSHAKMKPTYRHHQCDITYFIKLKIETPNILLSKTHKKEIIVYGDVKPIANTEPVNYELERYLFRPSSGKNHKVKLHIEVAKSFLFPGENIVLKIDISNDTDRIVNGIKIKLVRKITLTATCERRGIFEKEIDGCAVETESVEAYTEAAISTVVPTLPELYSIQNSKIINVEYTIKATVLLPMPHISPTIDIPIVIGELCSDMQMGVTMLDDYIDVEVESPNN